MESSGSERGFDRLVNFSDATVAIAITLLGLPLIDAADQFAEKSTLQFLQDNAGAFLAFGVSFLVIGQFWMRHHRFFDLVTGYTYTIAWINMVWLASIVLIPFAANALSASSAENGTVDALYIVTLTVTSGSMAAMEWWYLRHPELLAEGARDRLHIVDAIVTTVVFAIAAVLAVLVPTVGMFWLLLLLVSGRISALIVAVKKRRERR